MVVVFVEVVILTIFIIQIGLSLWFRKCMALATFAKIIFPCHRYCLCRSQILLIQINLNLWWIKCMTFENNILLWSLSSLSLLSILSLSLTSLLLSLFLSSSLAMMSKLAWAWDFENLWQLILLKKYYFIQSWNKRRSARSRIE